MAEVSNKVEEAWQRLHRDWPNHQDVTNNEIMAVYDQWEIYDEVRTKCIYSVYIDNYILTHERCLIVNWDF